MMEENLSEKNDDFKDEGDNKTLKSKEMLKNRDMVMTELADTERDYVDNLEIIVKKIIPVFRAVFKVNVIPDKLKKAATALFGNVEEIYVFHKNVFLDKMINCLEDPNLLGSSFVEHEETLMTIYASYCHNKPKSDDLLKDYEKEIEEVYQQYCLKQDKTMVHFLLMPIQRLTKYQLWIQSIIKYTSKAGQDTSEMQDALEVMEVVPKAANDQMHVGMITDHKRDLTLTEQKLILQDTLEVSIRRSKSYSRPREMRVFLFDNFMLMTELVERDERAPQYSIIFEGVTKQMGVTEYADNDEYKFAIFFRKYKTNDIYVCTAGSIETKDIWIKALRKSTILNALMRSPIGSPTQSRTQSSSAQGSANQSSLRQRSVSVGCRPFTEGIPYIPDFKSVKTRELPRELRRDRPQSAQTWTAVKQVTLLHPREHLMSEKLKRNIQRFLAEQYLQENKDVFICDI